MTRETAPFTVFYRTSSGEGGYSCDTCGTRRHDTFPRVADAFAAATQHLNLCRGALAHRPLEGSAIIDGAKHGAVLREGIMILALNPVFANSEKPVRVIA